MLIVLSEAGSGPHAGQPDRLTRIEVVVPNARPSEIVLAFRRSCAQQGFDIPSMKAVAKTAKGAVGIIIVLFRTVAMYR